MPLSKSTKDDAPASAGRGDVADVKPGAEMTEGAVEGSSSATGPPLAEPAATEEPKIRVVNKSDLRSLPSRCGNSTASIAGNATVKNTDPGGADRNVAADACDVGNQGVADMRPAMLQRCRGSQACEDKNVVLPDSQLPIDDGDAEQNGQAERAETQTSRQPYTPSASAQQSNVVMLPPVEDSSEIHLPASFEPPNEDRSARRGLRRRRMAAALEQIEELADKRLKLAERKLDIAMRQARLLDKKERLLHLRIRRAEVELETSELQLFKMGGR